MGDSAETSAGKKMKGRLFVISGPSGVGKGTLLQRVMETVPNLAVSVSATTRAPRPGEADGVNYYFMTREQFEQNIAEGCFLEYETYGSNLYGTPRAGVEAQRNAGLDVILEIEVKGAMQVKAIAPDAILVYIKPPSLEILEERLRGRQTESEETIQTRLRIAAQELKRIAEYDYCLVNDDLDAATAELAQILRTAQK